MTLDGALTAPDATRPARQATERIDRLRRREALRAGIFGIGSVLPERRVLNDELVARLDTTDDWIVRRTGIRERRWLGAGETLAGLAAEACTSALADAGRGADEVDHLIVSTITPDRITPGLGPDVAALIGARRAGAFDINAACAGFLQALEQATALIESGRSGLVVVCAAEALSRLTDHSDRSTAVLFGDGAGAVVVAPGRLDVGCALFELGCDGRHAELLYADRDEALVRMSGPEVYRHAVARMTVATQTVLDRAGLEPADLDLFVAHQANARILEAVADALGLPRSRLAVNVDRVANTSSASIPLALADAERDGRLRPGALVGLAAFGSGFVWGAGIVSWKERTNACA
jgi:3-oxoacyl-[acyl-carrier-protein] synthase-3